MYVYIRTLTETHNVRVLLKEVIFSGRLNKSPATLLCLVVKATAGHVVEATTGLVVMATVFNILLLLLW